MPIRSDPTPRPLAAAPVTGPARPTERAAQPTSSSMPVAASLPAGHPASARPAPRRPDPTTARLAVAAGGIATVSALLAAIAGAAVPAPTAAAAPTGGSTGTSGSTQTIVKYVYVQSGQTTPSVGIGTPIATPAPQQVPAPVMTRQSGAKP